MNTNAAAYYPMNFPRVSWVSDAARLIWQKRLVSFAECWRQLEWMTVVDNSRACGLLSVSQGELTSLASVLCDFGLRLSPLSVRSECDDGKRLFQYRVVVGHPRELRHFHKAWRDASDDRIGELLGYPACCRAFFHEMSIKQGFHNSPYAMVHNSVLSQRQLSWLEVSGPPETNTFWLRSGIRMVPHYPCKIDCQSTIQFAGLFKTAGVKAGYLNELDTAQQVLRWPVEWSSRHCITEIKTPIYKMCHLCGCSDSKQVIRFLGDCYPHEGANGSEFPFDSSKLQRKTSSLALNVRAAAV